MENKTRFAIEAAAIAVSFAAIVALVVTLIVVVPSNDGGGPSSPDNAFPEKFSAPYVLLSNVSRTNLTGGPSSVYVLAFVLAESDGDLVWDDRAGLERPDLVRDVEALRARGGDVIVSSGGADGLEIAGAFETPGPVTAAYQRVVDAYNLTWFDLDVEGPGLETAATKRRNVAVAALQKSNPRLSVSFTLPCGIDGLAMRAMDLLGDAAKTGVRVDVVNCMLMENDRGNSAPFVIAGATRAKEQLGALGLDGTKIGICVKIGVNDRGEPFTLEDAREVAAFAEKTGWIRLLSFWSLGRDEGSCAGADKSAESCSGLKQTSHAFANALKL